MIVPQFQSPTFPSQCSSPENNKPTKQTGHRKAFDKHVPVTVLEVNDDYGLADDRGPPKNRTLAAIHNYLRDTCCGSSSCCLSRPETGCSLNVTPVENFHQIRPQKTNYGLREKVPGGKANRNFDLAFQESAASKASYRSKDEICLVPPQLETSKRSQAQECADEATSTDVMDHRNDFDERNVVQSPNRRARKKRRIRPLFAAGYRGNTLGST